MGMTIRLYAVPSCCYFICYYIVKIRHVHVYVTLGCTGVVFVYLVLITVYITLNINFLQRCDISTPSKHRD